jgi:hypothetical protein
VFPRRADRRSPCARKRNGASLDAPFTFTELHFRSAARPDPKTDRPQRRGGSQAYFFFRAAVFFFAAGFFAFFADLRAALAKVVLLSNAEPNRLEAKFSPTCALTRR